MSKTSTTSATVPVLTLVEGIKVSGAKRFVASESFTQENGFYLWNNFKKYFLNKVEENILDTTLAIHRLEKRSLDDQIRKELGQEHEEIALDHCFDLLKNQSKGQVGLLLTDGCFKIAYIKGNDDKLWAVYAYWLSDDRYWHVDAYSVEYPSDWIGGDLVVSRDC